MKYIRTKDGKIIDINKYKVVKRMCDGVYYRNSDKEVWFVIYTEDIIKEADTIEELCDEFVCENSLIDSSPRKENGQIIGRYQKIDNAIMLAKKGLIVYGAIWTDKGLIYVAKMNEKGCLELL